MSPCRIHCPKCGFVTDAAGLADDAPIRCPECGFHYHLADGQIWNVTTTTAIGNVAKYVYGLIDFHQLDPGRFKAAMVKALLGMGWLGTPVGTSQGNNRIDNVVEMTDRITVAHGFPKNRA